LLYFKVGASMPESISVTVNADWGSDASSRRSTSGGMLQIGSALLLSWSRTQHSVSLSSCESEYYAIVTGICEARLLETMMSELGYKMKIRVMTDSQASRASTEKLGIQRVKHIQLRLLYVKELVQSGAVSVQKIDGMRNSADCLTKQVAGEVLRRCVELVGSLSLENPFATSMQTTSLRVDSANAGLQLPAYGDSQGSCEEHNLLALIHDASSTEEWRLQVRGQVRRADRVCNAFCLMCLRLQRWPCLVALLGSLLLAGCICPNPF